MTNDEAKALKAGDKVRVTKLNGSTRRFRIVTKRETKLGIELLLTCIGWTNCSWVSR